MQAVHSNTPEAFQMRPDPIYTSWLVKCASEDQVSRLLEYVAKKDYLGKIIKDRITHLSPDDGEPVTGAASHHVDDYFKSIWTRPGPVDTPASFRVVFHRRDGAGRFWKDLMIRFLEDLVNEAAPEPVTISLDYRGDEKPSEAPQPTSAS
jgi:hypothetical protein